MAILSRLASLFIVACSLCACGRVSEWSLSNAQKVNAAFPLPPELRLTQEVLSDYMKGEPANLDEFKVQMDSQLELRALACLRGQEIGRMTSVETVRGMNIDQSCLEKQNLELQRYMTLRAVGILLSRPPIRPLEKEALRSGVGIFSDGSEGNISLVDLSSKEVISRISAKGKTNLSPGRISPNGRVIAVAHRGRGLVFYDAEKAQEIGYLKEPIGTTVEMWLPGLQSFIIRGADGHIQIADGKTGQLETHRRESMGGDSYVAVPGSDAEMLFGSPAAIALLQFERTSSGISKRVIKTYTVPPEAGSLSYPIALVGNSRRLVYQSSGHLRWLNLESGEHGSWDTHDLNLSLTAQLEANQLLIRLLNSEYGEISYWVLDPAANKISQVSKQAISGSVVDVKGRPGFFVIGMAMLFGHAVAASEPVDFAKFIAEQRLKKQIDNVETMSRSAISNSSLQGRLKTSSMPSTPTLDAAPAPSPLRK